MRFSEAVEFTTSVVQYNIDEFKANQARGTTRTSDYIIPFFMGDPGLGKTAIPNTVAQNYDLPIAQAIVAQYDAGEMAGIPYIRQFKNEEGEEDSELIRARPDYLPNFTAGIFNLDEMPQAFLANQNICSQLVNEYRVGHHEISPAITIVATGNKPENKAGTTTIPTHLRDRIMAIEILPDIDDFLKYAAAKGLDNRIRSYLRENSGKLHKFDPTATASPTPRSWEKLSTILKLSIMQEAADRDRSTIRAGLLTEVAKGQIGDGYAEEFIRWLRVEDRLPKLADVIRAPMKAPLFGPEDISINYLLLSALADAAKPKNIENIITYVKRIEENKELMAMFAHDVFSRDESLMDEPAAKAFMLKEGAELML